ncbi:hypothetical protein [Shewanella woodyi]|uniref:hypothetical protein n=1 Tax=Shewanella woodyi TaxID=60961 RepID=UPI0007EB6E66|nr:hypothetical protein [Shewanella woodyi]
MKLVIFEVSSKNHSVMIYNWVKICQENEWHLQIVTTNEIYNQVKGDIDVDIDCVHFLRDYSVKEFLIALLKSRKADFLIITSLQNYFLHYIFLLLSPCKVLLTVHNINTWFSHKKIWNYKSILKDIVRFAWKKKASNFIVNSDSMKNTLLNMGYNESSFLVVPFAMRHVPTAQLNFCDASKRLSVVYPGMVSTKRKDYNFFLKLAHDFPTVDFILLGKLNFNEGALEVKEYIVNNKMKNVKLFEGFVEQAIFDKVMKESDLLFSYVNVDCNLQGIEERYGFTKDSGISYLMAEYALPLLVNSDFNNFRYLNLATQYYSCYSTLHQTFERLITDRNLRISLRNSIVHSRKQSSIRNVSSSVSMFLRGIK